MTNPNLFENISDYQSIVAVTLDSLRYDVAMRAETPNFDYLFKNHEIYGYDSWIKCYAQATYTLPSHVAFFQEGRLPSATARDHIPRIYNQREGRLFKMKNHPDAGRNLQYQLEFKESVVESLQEKGFTPFGTGGVMWFNKNLESSHILTNYFDEFVYKPHYAPKSPKAFESQCNHLDRLLDVPEKPFLFVNVSNTHEPYMKYLPRVEGQIKCMEFVDSHMDYFVDVIPKPSLLIIFSDHGECFGEDNMWGHGFYHPKVMEVPMGIFHIED